MPPVDLNPRTVAGGLVALGALPLAYAFVEARNYRVRSYRLPVLPPGSRPISVLQVSDFHLRVSYRKMVRFLELLHGRPFDLVLATGDLLGEPGAVDECVRLLDGLSAPVRGFVFGSSDYYAPILKNYLDYFQGRRRHGSSRNPTENFRGALTERGWVDLNNANALIELHRLKIQLTGLDDPYLHRDDRTLLVRDPSAAFGMLVVHDPAPYAEAIAAGYGLVVAGHTHGGQVRMPLAGALVTNSTLPAALARGPSPVGPGWLFVTPGLGTGKYAPFRFLCPPEVSVLQLTPLDIAPGRPGP
ncbi:MAG: metallophosphoesterase [Actinomycetota bacterium]